MRTAAEELGVPGLQALLHRLWAQRPLHYGEAYVECTQESLKRANGSLKTSTTMTSQSFRTLRNAYRRQVDHSEREGLSSGLSSSSMSQDRTEQPVVNRDKSHESGLRKFIDKTLKTHRLGLFWTDKGSRFSLTVKQRFENTSSRPIMTEGVFKSWMKCLESQNGESYRAHQGDEQLRQDHQLLHRTTIEAKTGIFVKLHEKSLNEMEELKKIQGSTFRPYYENEEVSRRPRYYPGTYSQDTGISKWN